MENISLNSFLKIAIYSDELELVKSFISKRDESSIEDIKDFITFINNSVAKLNEQKNI